MNLHNKNVVNIEEKDIRVDAFTYHSRGLVEGVHIDWASDTLDIIVDDETVCIYPEDVDRMIKCLQKAKAEFYRVKAKQNDDCVACEC